MTTLITLLGVLLLIVLAFAYGTLVLGLIFYKFWYWFLLPIFPVLPEITFAMAIGLSIFTTLLKSNYVSELDDKYKNPSKKYTSLIFPWVVLLLGYIVKCIIY